MRTMIIMLQTRKPSCRGDIVLLLLLLSSSSSSSSPTVDGLPNIFSRLNWGVVFSKTHNLINGASEHIHTFRSSIPNLDYTPLVQYPCQTENQRLAYCELYNRAIDDSNNLYTTQFRELDRAIGELLERAIPAMKLDVNKRKKRSTHFNPDFCQGDHTGGSENFLGRAVQGFTGTPSRSDLNSVRAHACQLALQVDVVKQEIVRGGQALSSVSNALGQRVDLARSGLDDAHSRLRKDVLLFTRFLRSYGNDSAIGARQIEFMKEAQSNFLLFLTRARIFEADTTRRLEIGRRYLADLNKALVGTLVPSLVSVSDIARVMDHIIANDRGVALVDPNPASAFQLVPLLSRTARDLFLTVKFPIRLRDSHLPVLGLYKVVPVKLALLENRRDSTLVTNVPDYFAVTPDLRYAIELSSLDLATCRHHRGDVLVTCSERAFIDLTATDNHTSCVAAIFTDNKLKVPEICRLRYLPNLTDGSEAVYVGDQTFFLREAHPGSWTLTCRRDASATTARAHTGCDSCLMRVPCGCSMIGDFYISTQMASTCEQELLDEKKQQNNPVVRRHYPINLHVFSQKYDAVALAGIGAANVVDEILTPLVPLDVDDLLREINITASTFPGVAEREGADLDFQKVMNAAKKKLASYSDEASVLYTKASDWSDLERNRLARIENMFDGAGGGKNSGGVLCSVMVAIAILSSIFICVCPERRLQWYTK